MIVTCPNCTARYKIPEAKIQGRGAKITCPNCSHKFVVYREGEEGGVDPSDIDPHSAAPTDIARRDFRQVGVNLKIRRAIGLTYDFNDLATLREYLDDGQASEDDSLSYDGRSWIPIRQIGVARLAEWFWDVWQKASSGELKPLPEEAEAEEDDASDAPTTIVGHGSSLADELRKASAEDFESVPPPPERTSAPDPQPEPPAPPGPAPLDPAPAPVARENSNLPEHDLPTARPGTFGVGVDDEALPAALEEPEPPLEGRRSGSATLAPVPESDPDPDPAPTKPAPAPAPSVAREPTPAPVPKPAPLAPKAPEAPKPAPSSGGSSVMILAGVGVVVLLVFVVIAVVAVMAMGGS